MISMCSQFWNVLKQLQFAMQTKFILFISIMGRFIHQNSITVNKN